MIATLLFFYLSSIIFIFGAEFNYHLERSYGHKIQEKEHIDASGNVTKNGNAAKKKPKE
jgi:uncharacterized BrkB/YihY/UPF0761 family membrane protein